MSPFECADSVIKRIEFWLTLFYVHFDTNNLGSGMNPSLILHPITAMSSIKVQTGFSSLHWHLV